MNNLKAGSRTSMTSNILERIADGRTDLVFDYLAQGHPAKSADRGGTALINWCAHYGDVSGMRFLLANGETLDSLGPNLGLDGAAFAEPKAKPRCIARPPLAPKRPSNCSSTPARSSIPKT
jgi:hypothetical protein